MHKHKEKAFEEFSSHDSHVQAWKMVLNSVATYLHIMAWKYLTSLHNPHYKLISCAVQNYPNFRGVIVHLKIP